MTRIKEFKGSLNPIFNDGLKNDFVTESDVHASLQQSKDFLSIDRIKPRNDQPRKIFNDESLNELAQSIKLNGVIQPIIVSQTTNGDYEIIVGERRWRAAKKAGLEKIPAIVRQYSKSDGMAVALIENIQRENLNPLEEAQAIQKLLEECGMTHNQVAESIGKSRTAVSNLLRLLALTPEVKSMINSGLLEMGHARALLSLDDEKQAEVGKIVVSKNLSVRETEKLVQRVNSPINAQEIYIDPIFEKKAHEWERNFSKKISSKVNVNFTNEGKGKVVIHFDSIEEADWLMEHIHFIES